MVFLCYSIIQVLASNEKEQVLKEIESKETIVFTKKSYIHDDDTKLTEEHKTYAYAFYPVAERFFATQAKHLTRLIIEFLLTKVPSKRTFYAPNSNVILLCKLSADDQWLAALYEVSGVKSGRSLILWDMKSGLIQWDISGAGELSGVIFTSDNQKIISPGYDGYIKIWSVWDGTLHQILTCTDSLCQDCILSEDNCFLSCLVSTALCDFDICIWSLHTGRCTTRRQCGDINWMQFSTDNKQLMFAGGDEQVRVWNLETNICRNLLKGHTDCILKCQLSTNKQLLLTTSLDNTARVWQLNTKNCIQIFTDDKNSDFQSWGYFVRQDTCVVWYRRRTLKLWSIEDGQVIREFPNYFWNIYTVSPRKSFWLKSEDAECIFDTPSQSTEIRILAVESGDVLLSIDDHLETDQIIISSDGKFMLTENENRIAVYVFSEAKKLHLF